MKKKTILGLVSLLIFKISDSLKSSNINENNKSSNRPIYFNPHGNLQRQSFSVYENINQHNVVEEIQLRQLQRQNSQHDNYYDHFDKNYGVLIGRMSPRAHGIHGLVYAVDETHLFIRNFRYDGTGPDAYFWVGDDNLPSPKGHIIPYPPLEDKFDDPEVLFPGNNFEGRFETKRNRNLETLRKKTQLPPTLKKMQNENVLLTLPGSLKITSIKWLAVWCLRFTVSYGFVLISKDVIIPKQEIIDPFSSIFGKISSGRIKILDNKSFYIPNLQLHVTEKGYHFWAGNSTKGPNQNGYMIPNEKAQTIDLVSYNGNDIIITLPNHISMYDINYLAIYSSERDVNMGHVTFDSQHMIIPPALGQTKKPGWWFDTPLILPEDATIFTNTNNKSQNKQKQQHIPFNPSLNLPNCRELLGRKIRLLWKNEGGHIYFRIKVHMEIKQIVISNMAYVLIQYSIQVMISILPKDAHDAPIALNEPTQVIVAIGSNKVDLNSYNSNKMNLEKENTTINFSNNEDDVNCPDVYSPLKPYTPPEPEEVWKPSNIRDRKLFVARLGPPGGKKGYGAITGNPPLINVVWWINGKLMPEIYVERGKTYHFRIQGGDDASRTNSFHPLYITDNAEGGYILKPQYERSVETIYAGVEEYDLEPMATGVGPLCEFVSYEADKTYESQTFKEYKRTLRLACTEGREQEYGWVNWTVDHNTPDLLYYQSFADYAMGWKIHVLNEGEVPPDVASKNFSLIGLVILSSVLIVAWNLK
ncbi:protein Skeletor, isoforms B/C isoform X2 [Lepeophtheirus salmonis]|uniref:protein Skeletor, isoforms B/C isoform X2 n=1 Tax=Lepeophtheirus salmonis TaxID=72036 RepID=UPI003AF349EB